MATKLLVTLDEREREALAMLCEQDSRPAKWQLKHLVLAEAQRRGLISIAPSTERSARCDATNQTANASA